VKTLSTLPTFARKDIDNTPFKSPKKMLKVSVLLESDKAKQKQIVISLN
jgi:hypothetical protein